MKTSKTILYLDRQNINKIKEAKCKPYTQTGTVMFYIQTNYFINKKLLFESTQTEPLRQKGRLFLLAPGSSQSVDRLSALSLTSNEKNQGQI